MESPRPITPGETQTVELESDRPSASLLDDILVNIGTLASQPRQGSRTSGETHQIQQALDWHAQVERWASKLKKQQTTLSKIQFQLSRDIGRIDAILESQVNEILHNPQFQQLESQWRGLEILCTRAADLRREVEGDDGVVEAEIRMLPVTKRELYKDFDKAIEFDQNDLFQKIYEEEYGMSGGTPYGLLLANFEFTNHPNDIDLLDRLAGVGAAAFCPVITAASASMMGVENLTQLEQPYDVSNVFQQSRFRKWLSLRKNTDTQFLGVALPRVLMRLPYEDDGMNRHGFRFREDVASTDQNKYLWGPASWAFACVVLRAFMQSGWFADIRGMQRGVDGGGIVSEFPVHSFGTDNSPAAQKSCVEVAISDPLENELSQAGFITLSDCKDTPFSVFFSNQSVHEPVVYSDQVSTANARVSAMLQYVMCCSRVAHFLRIEARNKIGSTQSARTVEDHLNRWITRYVTPDTNAPASLKAEYPLQKANILVEDVPGKPGEYRVTIHLQPHYQLDSLSSTMTLTAHRLSHPGAN